MDWAARSFKILGCKQKKKMLSVVLSSCLLALNIYLVAWTVMWQTATLSRPTDQTMMLINHRGYGEENTLEAVLLAQKLGYDGVEIDVRTTREGIPFLAHDSSFSRITGGKVRSNIETLTREDVMAIKTEGGRSIPLLKTVLASLNAKGKSSKQFVVVLDTKTEVAVQAVLDMMAGGKSAGIKQYPNLTFIMGEAVYLAQEKVKGLGLAQRLKTSSFMGYNSDHAMGWWIVQILYPRPFAVPYTTNSSIVAAIMNGLGCHGLITDTLQPSVLQS